MQTQLDIYYQYYYPYKKVETAEKEMQYIEHDRVNSKPNAKTTRASRRVTKSTRSHSN